MSQEKLQIIKRYIIYIIGTVMLTFFAYCVLLVPQMQIRIIYALGQKTETEEYLRIDTQGIPNSENTEANSSGNTITVIGRINLDDTASRRMFDAFFTIPTKSRVTRMEFQLQPRTTDKDSRIQIRTIEILNNHLSQKKYTPREIEKIFSCEQVSDLTVEDDRLCITTKDGNNAVLIANEKFLSDYNDSLQPAASLLPNLLLMALLMMTLAILLDYYITVGKWKTRVAFGGEKDTFQLLMAILMIAAAGCVILMALCSRHYAHPDEDATRAAIDYYMAHWLPPSSDSASLLGTYSNYGVTRLTEYTLYYLVAGKIGWIFAAVFHISKYYRILNVLLFMIMVSLLLRHRRNNLWMIIALGITPQLWYLFSYATSDAWDFFWSFVVVYELLEENSIFQKYLRKQARYPILSVLGIAFSLSMLFRAKPNYYLILLFTFLILVIRWFRTKDNKAALLSRYIIVALCSMLLLFPRIELEKYINKSNKNVQTEEYKATATTVVTTRKARGYSLLDVVIKDGKDIVSNLTNSGVGSYGWLEYHNSYWYGFGITGLYGIVVLFILFYMIRNRHLAGAIDACVLTGMSLLGFLMVVYTCWSSDFQAQGRYVLLLTLVIGFFSMQEKEIYKDKKMQILLILLIVISLISYVGKGLVNLI
ncbi:MAG: DUF2142 domain-containing protein [Lachnospiraceae bacterium]|nr:DUF2142 domain-containing protein [Lachnospiraceae bacterium]